MTAPLKADITAADRVLKAAVRRSVQIIRDAKKVDVTTLDGMVRAFWCRYDRRNVVALLTAATYAADLLLTDTANGGKR